MRPVRIAGVVLALVGAVMVAGAGVVLLILMSLPHISFDLDFSSRRPKPIPVSKRACPYLRAVRTTGNAAAISSLDLWDVRPAARAKVDYPKGYVAQLAAFDLSLRVAATQVPARLRRKLKEVAANVEFGRSLVAKNPDPQTYAERSIVSMGDGAGALSYADALLGDQCGFRLTDFSTFI